MRSAEFPGSAIAHPDFPTAIVVVKPWKEVAITVLLRSQPTAA